MRPGDLLVDKESYFKDSFKCFALVIGATHRQPYHVKPHVIHLLIVNSDSSIEFFQGDILDIARLFRYAPPNHR